MANCGCQDVLVTSYTQVSNVNTGCGHTQACNGCLDIIKGGCVKYTGSNLLNLLIDKNANLNEIMVRLDAIQLAQNTKNANILLALNDINDRLNALESGPDHDPYILL